MRLRPRERALGPTPESEVSVVHSSPQPSHAHRPVWFGPTPALTRSIGIGLVLVLVGAVVHRVDVVLLATPFCVHVAFAFWRRPRSGRIPDRPIAMAAAEGAVVNLPVRHLDLPERALVGTQWPMLASATFDPPYGTLLDAPDDDEPLCTRFEPQRWGRYGVEAPRVVITDESLGWRAVTLGPDVTVTVRPAALTLEGASGVAHPIGVTGAHTSLRRGEGSALADVREFSPGDRLRRINWRVTSRTGTLHVNSTLTDRDTDVLVVTDTLNDIPGVHPEDATSLDSTARAVAAITQHYVGFGDRVGLFDLGRRIGPARAGAGPRQVRIVLNVLSRAHRAGKDWDTVRRVPRLADGTLVFACSPLLEPKIIDEIVRLRQLGGELVVIDTLPEGRGAIESLHGRDETWLTEAMVVRRLERDAVIERLRGHGIPVTPWRGPTSLASVLLAMEVARRGPRRSVGR